MKPVATIIINENNLFGRRRIEIHSVGIELNYDRRGHAPYGVWTRYDDGMVDRRKQQRRKGMLCHTKFIS